jgi:signal transduction histidine kinase
VLKRLRRRFILITMLLVGVVLIAVLVTNVVSSYNTQYNQLMQTMQSAATRGANAALRPWVGNLTQDQILNGMLDGSLGGSGSGSSSGTGTGSTNGSGSDDASNSASVGSSPQTNTPVYVITYDALSGQVYTNSNEVYMSQDLLNEALGRITATSPDSGLFGDLDLFYLRDSSDAQTTVAFASSSALYASLWQQVALSIGIGVVALAAFFAISLLLSRIALRPVEEAWTRQRQFIADASHELKTPLTVILANTSILQGHPAKTVAEQSQWVESTHDEAERMNGLVRDLLLLAQTDEAAEKTGRSRHAAATKMAPVDLSALVEGAVLQFDAVFFERGIELETSIAPHVTVPGTRDRLERLVTILLDNASKYASGAGPTGKPHVKVTLLAEAGGHKHHARLLVWNTGEPVPPDLLPHLFERFYRGDSAHSEAVEGYGLGLSLAKGIVESHNGTIEVTSTRENGTLFTVVL